MCVIKKMDEKIGNAIGNLLQALDKIRKPPISFSKEPTR